MVAKKIGQDMLNIFIKKVLFTGRGVEPPQPPYPSHTGHNPYPLKSRNLL